MGFSVREEESKLCVLGRWGLGLLWFCLDFYFIVILHLEGGEINVTTYSAILNESSKHFHVIFHLNRKLNIS